MLMQKIITVRQLAHRKGAVRNNYNPEHVVPCKVLVTFEGM